MALAKALRRWLEHGHLNHRRGRLRPRCYTVTFTSKLGSEAELRIKLAEFISVFESRAPKGGALFALDRAPATGRWHVHAVMLLPPTFDASKVVRWWTRLWPRAVRPTQNGGQKILAIGVEKIDMVLAHHLGRTRKGAPIPNLPPLAERIVACGSLARPWALVAQAKGVPNAPAAPKPKKRVPRAKKASTSPLPIRTSPPLLNKEHCLWCAKPLASGARKDTQRHAGCRRSASRAKTALARGIGRAARSEVERLELRGWPTRDAIRAVERASMIGREMGMAEDVLPRGLMTFVVCRCGEALGKSLSAKTCGRARCRKRAWDARHPLLRRSSLRPLFRAFVEGFGNAPFTHEQAVCLGQRMGFTDSKVTALIQELVQDELAVEDSAETISLVLNPRWERIRQRRKGGQRGRKRQLEPEKEVAA